MYYGEFENSQWRFSIPSRSIHLGDVSEANGRERPWQKQNAHAYVAFEIQDFVNSRKLWFFKKPLWIFARSTHFEKSSECYS